MFMKFQKVIAAILAAALCLGGMSSTVFAYNYDFGSGPNPAFGKSSKNRPKNRFFAQGNFLETAEKSPFLRQKNQKNAILVT